MPQLAGGRQVFYKHGRAISELGVSGKKNKACGAEHKFDTSGFRIRGTDHSAALPLLFLEKNSLTQVKMCNCSVAVQFSFEIFILTVNFNSLSIEVNGIAVIFLSVCFITLVKVNLSYR